MYVLYMQGANGTEYDFYYIFFQSMSANHCEFLIY